MKTCVILCAGDGKRLLPITNIIPKQLLPFKNTNILSRHIENLRNNNFERLYLIGNPKYKIFFDEFEGNRGKMEINVYYPKERSGTAWELYELIDELPEKFGVIYGDTVIRNYDFLNKGKIRGAAEISCFKTRNERVKNNTYKLKFEEDRISNFFSKSRSAESYVMTGLVNINRDVLENVNYMKRNKEILNLIHLFENLLSENKNIYGFKEDNFSFNINDIEDYRYIWKDEIMANFQSP